MKNNPGKEISTILSLECANEDSNDPNRNYDRFVSKKGQRRTGDEREWKRKFFKASAITITHTSINRRDWNQPVNNSIYSPLFLSSVGKTTAGLTARRCNWIFREPRPTNYFWQGIITKRRGIPVSTLIHYFEVCTPSWRVLYSRAIVFHSIIGLSARCLFP